MWLLIAFVAVPLIEIALFIQVGGYIGLWPTLAIVLLTAIIGTMLVRSQGLQALGQVRGSFLEARDPTAPLAHGAMIIIAATLLLTPGFFTDTIGFLLLIPGVRRVVIEQVKSRVKIAQFEMHTHEHRRPTGRETIIEADYKDVSEPGPKPDEEGASGWTRR